MISYAFEFTGPIKLKEAHIHIKIQPSISTKSCSESFPTFMFCSQGHRQTLMPGNWPANLGRARHALLFCPHARKHSPFLAKLLLTSTTFHSFNFCLLWAREVTKLSIQKKKKKKKKLRYNHKFMALVAKLHTSPFFSNDQVIPAV